jgi:hypothetical protein
MDRGAQWFADIGAHLKTADYGLLCVTPENAKEPWVQFEAGALALRTSERLACPYLLDMTPAALEGPLGQLQAAIANRDGTWQVVETINRLLDEVTQLSGERLRIAFDQWWPNLEAQLGNARRIAPPIAAPERTMGAKVDEILEIVRALQRSSSASPVETTFGLTPLANLGISASQFSDLARRLGNVGLLTANTASTPKPGDPKEPVK